MTGGTEVTRKPDAQKMAALASRDGVGASCVALPPGAWTTIADFLEERFPAVGRNEWHARMHRGDVFDDSGVPLPADAPYRSYRKVFYYRSLPNEPRIPFEAKVLFQDDLLVVVDKPHFLPVVPSGIYLQETVLVRLKRALGIDTLTPMHRIDRDTAGLVLFTVLPQTRGRYQALFRDRVVKKVYEAIAPWRAELTLPLVYRSRLQESAAFMQMAEVPGQSNAETRIELIARRGAVAHYRLQPSSGQKHQLRVHMAALGVGIVNDRIYPNLQPPLEPNTVPDYSQPLQLLARSVTFLDPVSGQERHFESRRRLQF